MDARNYYNQKTTRRRKLEEGDGIRNTHNFIKAVLINEYIPEASHILDLGCGQGGDLLKYKRRNPSLYRGIDISHTAIEAASNRFTQIGVKCRSKFECIDFATKNWSCDPKMDVVSCQFALQYGFSMSERADHLISRISTVLKPGGVLLGTIPVHSEATYSTVVVQLPDDTRKCVEYSAQRKDITTLCAKYGLDEHLWMDFDSYYDSKKTEYADLCRIMRAHARPDPNNAVFVFKSSVLSGAQSPKGKDLLSDSLQSCHTNVQ